MYGDIGHNQNERELVRLMTAIAMWIVRRNSKNMADNSEPPVKDVVRVILKKTYLVHQGRED